MRRDWALWRSDVCRWLLQVGAIGAILGIGYLVWGGLKGYFAFPTDPTRVATVANTLAYFLYCCGWMVGLGLIGLFWEWKPIGITVFLSSAFAWVLMPFVFATIAGANTDLTMRGVDALRSFLTPLLVVSFVQSVWAFVEYWRRGPTLRSRASKAGQLVVNLQREKEKRVAKRYLITPLSPCWKLPVIDKLMCEHCPVKQRKRPCWKLKAGCQCSPAIVDALLTEMAEKVDEKRWLLSSTLLQWQKGQRPPCHRCSIFLHHQQVKYDWLAPIAFLAPPVLLVVKWEQYQDLYTKIVLWLNQLWMQIAFTPTASPDPLGLNNQTMAIYVAIILGVIAMVYAVRLVEFLVFRLFL
ncbi:hypothetical protein Q2T83_05535 [Fervidibacter sacchari]|jgi:hypothetical protein|uniref:Uncharacterized protein n=1 Tax=Candidatus Fervidibacter sacchari TaxID=1448929 RepID=A0ABT2EM07_9BACT|nr:hypothetical protein [Candidatus Fervidibacter sacchari]MCS3918980.1 hypothetical protein [Candidatus Fervidibacter sacchari]WKU17283.1 hypothetical protein Q2T83_05535 [Candidatus Fervidibacter sacchari]